MSITYDFKTTNEENEDGFSISVYDDGIHIKDLFSGNFVIIDHSQFDQIKAGFSRWEEAKKATES